MKGASESEWAAGGTKRSPCFAQELRRGRRVPLLVLGIVGMFVAGAADNSAPEPGFVDLFNGRDFTGWGAGADVAEKLDGKAATSDGRYSVENGVILVHAHDPRLIQQINTLRLFPNDFVLRVEFRGALGSDSGIFVRGVQLQCREYRSAGPYTNLTKYRPLDWNEIEITVKGGIAYTTCNGQVLEPSMIVPLTGRIGLEADTGQMEFRRVRIRELPARAGR